MITASILLISLLKSYVIVGLISVAIMPKTRQLIAAALSRAGLRRTPIWAYALYCVGVAASTALVWPQILRRAYVTPGRTRAQVQAQRR